jgi:hypothetical protein
MVTDPGPMARENKVIIQRRTEFALGATTFTVRHRSSTKLAVE